MKRNMILFVLLGASGAAVYAGLATMMPRAARSVVLTELSAVPTTINHQGVVTVNGIRFSGSGLFRFAIVDPDSGNNVWTNDGTNVGTSNPPTAAVSLSVADGVYSVALGNTSLSNMTAVSSDLFTDDNLRLRVWFDDGVQGSQQLSPDHALSSVPYAMSVADGTVAGEVKLWAGPIANVPAGWLACDGSAVSRTTYARLFQVVGTIYGPGDGSTTFNLPDLRDRVPIGAKQDDTGVPKTNVTGSLTQTGGQATQTLTTDELPAHSHSGVTSSGNAAFYRVVGAVGTSSVNNHLSGYSSGSYADHTDTSYPMSHHTHNFTTDAVGGGEPFSTLDPYLAMVYIIKY